MGYQPDIHDLDPERGIQAEDYAATAIPPTDRQLAYAEHLAGRRGITVPATARRDCGVCGAFISESRKVLGLVEWGRKPPSLAKDWQAPFDDPLPF